MFRIGSLCSGYGGLDMAVQAVFGGDLVWWSDIERGPIEVMRHHYPRVPNIGDLKAVGWESVAPIDILTAGYPCQPFSNAGKRLGTEDPRHLWPWIADAIGVLRPGVVVLENVAAHLRRGFDTVSGDLAERGYDTTWAVVSAAEVGAPHLRKRLFVLATDTACELPREARSTGGLEPPSRSTVDWVHYTSAVRRWEQVLGRIAPPPVVIGPRGGRGLSPLFVEWMMGLPAGHVTAIEGLSRSAQLKMLGNGVVPQQAEAGVRHLLTLTQKETSPAAFV